MNSADKGKIIADDIPLRDLPQLKRFGMGQDKFQAWFSQIPARKSILRSKARAKATPLDKLRMRCAAERRCQMAPQRESETGITGMAPAQR